MPFNEPLSFCPNRVWRCYTGGALLDRFTGASPEKDGHEPEDWLASTVRAVNGAHSQGPDEGLARLRGAGDPPGPRFSDLLDAHATEILGRRHAARYGGNLAVLCKYLDSSVRLPIQCHPDRALAKTLYHSDYGKTECWYILDTRTVDGQPPYLLMGFQPGVTRKAFAEAVAAQNVAAMERMLHKVHCRPGEMYFIPGRFPHAIGPGVFMLETQEPSDWVIQPERTCADTCLSDADMWGPLTPEQGLDVFDYTGLSADQMLGRVLIKESPLSAAADGRITELIGTGLTPAFAVQRAVITGTLTLALPRDFGIVVVADGQGVMSWSSGNKAIRRGDYFLVPAGCPSITCATRSGPLTLLVCLPPAT